MVALDRGLVDALRRLDACAVSNAVESFDVRLRNEGFADGRIRALFDDLPPAVGHAVTARIRTSTPPPVGHRYIDRTDWWNYILTLPAPRIVVVEDIDPRPGFGAFIGEVHASILIALGAAGYVTNGAVRDLPAVRRAGLPLFAGSTSVSHAFVHIVDFGTPVEIAGLPVAPGDVLFADRHGVLTIPDEVVARVPDAVTAMRRRERTVLEMCSSPNFSVDNLRSLVHTLD